MPCNIVNIDCQLYQTKIHFIFKATEKHLECHPGSCAKVVRHSFHKFFHFQDLKDLMRRAGEVTYANAHNEKRNEG